MKQRCLSMRSRRLRAIGWWLALALLGLVPASALAQVPVVAELWMEAPPPPGTHWLVEALKPLGQVEGRNFVVESRYASGDNARFPALARELLERRPAVIVAPCGPAQRAIRALDATIPIVAGCADPRNFLGEVKSLQRPGGRTTGFTLLAPESAAKRLQLLKQLLPNAARVGVLQHRNDDWATYWEEMEKAANGLGIALAKLPVARAEDLDEAFATAMRQRIDALVVFPDATTVGARQRIAELAVAQALPTVFDTRLFVDDGGLFSYGPDWAEFGRRVFGTYVDKILRGASPGDLPIQQPTRLELVINLKTARALGLRVPKSFIARADSVIE